MPAIAPITIKVLQHLYTHGACTRAEIVKALGSVPYSTLNNLRVLGHVTIDHATKDPTYSITPRGRNKLAGTGQRRSTTDTQRLDNTRKAKSYQGAEIIEPSNRPGSMDAFALPSRVGSRLHWPDGRITNVSNSTGETR